MSTPAKPTTFLEVLQWTPDQARAYLEQSRWPDGPVCPNGCASGVYRITARTRRNGKDGPVRNLIKCKACRRQFTATVGTPFGGSPIRLNIWMAAVYLLCSSKKGLSAHQLHRMLRVSYRTAWFIEHRLRYLMTNKSIGKLSGLIEADETYVGGRVRGHPKTRTGGKSKARYENKTPVFGILERGGRVRPVVIEGIGKAEVVRAFQANVDVSNSILVTDESPLYGSIKGIVPHRTVKHAEEYVTGDGIHTQGIENFWSLLKRQLYGTHHHVEARFLGMYANEAAFKFNTRKLNDGERFAYALQNADGRLTWYFGKQARKVS